MFSRFSKLFGEKGPQKSSPMVPESSPTPRAPQRGGPDRTQSYTKVFRWRLPDGETHEPKTVEVVGSFTQWQRIEMARDSALDAWHATIHHIPGNRTHHYMVLVDGQPTYDRNSDGLAVPANPQEERYQIMTDRGPRVFMLFAQAK